MNGWWLVLIILITFYGGKWLSDHMDGSIDTPPSRNDDEPIERTDKK